MKTEIGRGLGFEKLFKPISKLDPSKENFLSVFKKKMWITGKVDQTSQKDQLFTSICNECRTLAPGAMLSYKLRNRLDKLSKEERKEVVSRTYDGCAPLFVACQRGNTEVVEYLIKICGADTEQKGLYEVPDDHSVHHVTPLWCAAVAGKLAVVKCLVQHGADVNSVSDTGSTPVRSACFMTHYDIVSYLVEHGANISKPNYNGGTCLINSVQSVRLCEFLILNGADVNAQDIQNKTALHYAIQEHRFETTKLLLESGAKPYLKSNYNDDALQTACIKGACQIFKYLIENVDYCPSRIAEGYELLGSTYLDEHHDIQVALKYWREAAVLRRENGIDKNVGLPTKHFQYVREFSTLGELETVALDEDTVRIQSLLICERILGAFHKDMVFRLMYRGAAYADSLQYQKCISLWLYALQLRIKRDTILYNDTCFTAQALVRLYLDMIEKFNAGQIPDTIKFDDAYQTLIYLSSELPSSVKLLRINPVHKRHQMSFDTVMKVITHMIYVLLHIQLTSDERHSVAVVVNQILKLDPRTNHGGFSLLHLTVMRTNVIYNNSLLEDQHMTPFPSIEVVNFLIECGADVNATTSEKGLSPLYIASQQRNYKPEVVQALINAGAHIDQATASGETPSSLLAKNPDSSLSPVALTSLKCLAAKVIQTHSIPYEGEIPVHLEPFIQMH